MEWFQHQFALTFTCLSHPSSERENSLMRKVFNMQLRKLLPWTSAFFESRRVMQNTLTSPLAGGAGAVLCLTHPQTPSLLWYWWISTDNAQFLGNENKTFSVSQQWHLPCDGKGQRTSPAWHFLAPVVPWWQGLGFVWGYTAALSALIQELPSQGPAPAQAGQGEAIYSCKA